MISYSKINSKLSTSFIGIQLLTTLYNIRNTCFKLIRFNFKKSIPLQPKNHINNNTQVFFIVGAGRSGNTLLRAILDTNENVVVPPELYSFKHIIKTALKNRFLTWEKLCCKVVDVFFNTPDTDVWEIDRAKLTADLLSYKKEHQNIAKLAICFHEYYAKNRKKTGALIGDKTPLNSYNLWWIHKLYPEAKYIHMHRDGRDVVMSYKKSGLYKTYTNAAHRWNNSVNNVHAFERKFNMTPKVHKCGYEDLVLNTETVIQNVCKFLQVPFNTKMITSYQKQFKSMGDTTKFSHHSNVQKSVFTSSIGKWQKMDKEKLEQITPIMEKNLKKLSY
ncbi:sulfotransferase family protein [Pseudotamlana agarivorans]|uniref:sulfotransferase family protein n=1 Tax=Pseudotamlana agarivorans TaxID=481183 RepID=UPI000834E117|nr:sulfotransferase [Tamlana agarivorans]